jgi:hypothetical protein
VGAATLKPGATKKVIIRGKEDVPASDVGAVLLRLRTAGARKPGTLGIASSGKKIGSATAFAYPKGAGQDLALSKLSSGGAVVLKNRGKRKVKVTLDAVSSFSAGGDPQAFGDTLSVVSPVDVAVTETTTTASPFLGQVTGIGDIPAEATSVPPSLTLVRTLAHASASGILSVVPEHAPPGVPSLRLRSNKSSAGLVPAESSSDDLASFAVSSGSAELSAEAYAYFAGGTVMDPGFRVLSEADLAAIQTDPPANSVTFSAPVPSDLDDLAVGDIMQAGSSDHTPTGFLRKVISIDTSGSDLVVQTEDAGIADAVDRAELSWGSGAKGLNSSVQQSASPTQQGSNAKTAEVPPETSCSANLFWVGASVGCGIHENVGGASLDVSESFQLSWEGSIDVGLTGAHMTSTITASDTLTGTLSAGLTNDELDYTKSLYEKFLGCPGSVAVPAICSFTPFPPIGGLDLWITPTLSLDLKVNGHIDSGLTATGSVTKSASASFDSDSGTSLKFGLDQPEGNLTKDLTKGDAEVKVSAVASANFYLTFAPVLSTFRDSVTDGTIPSTKLSASIKPYLRFNADFCAVRAFYGLDFSLSLALKALGISLVDVSWTHNITEKEIFDRPWRNCAVWSGTITVTEKASYDNGLPADQGHYKLVESGAASVTIHVPKDKEPPEDGIYHEKGAGSGLYKTKTWMSCTDDQTVYFPYTEDVRWGGKLTVNGGPANFTFDLRDDSHRRYYVTGPNPNSFGTHWDKTVSYKAQNFLGYCTDYQSKTSGEDYGYHVWSLIEDHSESSRIAFKVNEQGHAQGSLTLLGANPQDASWFVSYSLQKLCTKGGLNC